MVGASADVTFMERALFLAERGRGLTSPNPLVGAVVVSASGVIVGHGAHLRAGGPHAEVIALAAAGPRSRGGTLYCNLEPCCHAGRTGPCVERIVPAGIVRVVAAMTDPNPRVAGAGFTYLRAHGVSVSTGAGEEAARDINAPFVQWITRARPFVTVKIAVSADGFAGRSGERVRLTGAAADRYFHRQRAEVDAIAVGATTVLADDPLLTARHVYRARPLMRVLFDWRMRVPPAARVFSTLSSGPVIMAVRRSEAEQRPRDVAAFAHMGADVVAFEDRDVTPVVQWLGSREITSLLVEGGPGLHRAFFEAGEVDRVQRVQTKVPLGSGVPAADGPGPGRAWVLPRRTKVLGDDLLVESDVHGTD